MTLREPSPGARTAMPARTRSNKLADKAVRAPYRLRFTVPMHARSERRLSMDLAFVAAEVTRPTNVWQHGFAPPPYVGGYGSQSRFALKEIDASRLCLELSGGFITRIAPE